MLLVYIPLGFLTLGFVLLVAGALSGPGIWLLLLLGAYCVLPVRLLLERRRRGLPLPSPRPAEEPFARPAEEPRLYRPAPSAPLPRPPANINRLTASQRAMAGIVAIAVLLLVGGILLVFGMGRLDSSLGLLLAAIGGFLMILSVTVPTFRLFDLLLRAVARLIGRSAGGSGRASHQPGNRSRTGPRSSVRGTRNTARTARLDAEREESRRMFPPDLF